MTNEPDKDELVALLDRRHAARSLMRVAYDRFDLLAEEVEAVTGGGRIALRPDLLIALSEAQQAARTANTEMKDAEYALDIATRGLPAQRQAGDVVP